MDYERRNLRREIAEPFIRARERQARKDPSFWYRYHVAKKLGVPLYELPEPDEMNDYSDQQGWE